MTGPVQVLVLGFDEQRFTGEVLAELDRLRASGIVRLVDVMLVSRGEDGTFETLPAPPGAEPGTGQVAAAVLGLAGTESVPTEPVDEHTWSLADAIAPGGTGAVALIEHTWAEPLVGAVRRTGGRLLDETWLAPGDVARLAEHAG